MRLNPKQRILELDGAPAKLGEDYIEIGFLIHFIVIPSTTIDPLISFRISQKCNKEEPFDLNGEQLKAVKDEVVAFSKRDRMPNGTPRPFNNLVLGQLLATLDGEDIGIVEKIDPKSKKKPDDSQSKSSIQPKPKKKVSN